MFAGFKFRERLWFSGEKCYSGTSGVLAWSPGSGIMYTDAQPHVDILGDEACG